MKPLSGIIPAAIIVIGLLFVGGSGTSGAAPSGPFQTGAPAYMAVAPGVSGSVQPLITTGDELQDGFVFPSLPDGTGMVAHGSGTADVFVSHEYNPSNPPFHNAQVSRVRVHAGSAAVLSGELMLGNDGGYARFCSASTIEGFGFEHPLFLANEEVDDGIVVALDTKNGQITELPWLGLFSHENTILVPLFYESLGKIVLLSFEDGDATDSEVYLYVADSAKDLLDGNGQLYVFAASASEQWDDIYYGDSPEGGSFVPVEWDHRNQDEGDLHDAAMDAGAFRFIRPEDGAVDKRPAMGNIIYMADTGNDLDADGARIAPGSNGQNWTHGRVYRFAFTDPGDPTQATFEVLLDGNDPSAPGYDLMINPDNIDTSLRTLMIQEDRIGATRSPVVGPYDLTKNAKVLAYDLATGDLGPVAYVDQSVLAPTARYGDWESSGILDASHVFGEGAWLLDVQAHSLEPNGPAGQLLLLRLNNR